MIPPPPFGPLMATPRISTFPVQFVTCPDCGNSYGVVRPEWSIGYGTRSKEGETIDQAEADTRLASELGSHRARVETAVGKTGLKFTATELDALTSFDYNTGKVETLLANGTRSKQQIADTMLLYRNAGGERLRGLENRRKAERHLFLYGRNA